jgi:hypothetical protein
MKVDNLAPNLAEVTRIANETPKLTGRCGPRGRVKLGNLRLAEDAVQAATTDDVRPDAVAEARALMARSRSASRNDWPIG